MTLKATELMVSLWPRKERSSAGSNGDGDIVAARHAAAAVAGDGSGGSRADAPPVVRALPAGSGAAGSSGVLAPEEGDGSLLALPVDPLHPAAPQAPLVEGFDIEPFPDFSAK